MTHAAKETISFFSPWRIGPWWKLTLSNTFSWEFEFRDSLPKTLMNKVDFKKLEKEEQEKYDEVNKDKE